MIITRASELDIPEILRLWMTCRNEEVETLEESQEEYPKEPSSAAVENFLQMKFNSPYDEIFLAKEKGEIVGILSSSLQIRPAGDPMLYMMAEMMYIKPKYRRGPAKKKLVEAWKNWVEELDLPVENVELIAMASEKQVNRWTKQGWKPYAVMMQKRIEEVRG